jgi:hypothetical protein
MNNFVQHKAAAPVRPKKAMVDGMDEVVNGLKADGPPMPIAVEVESSKT